MKHLKKFNETTEAKSFKNSDDDIRMFFTDYTDDKTGSLTIENGLVYDGQFITETTYMKDTSKYRRAKLITLDVCDADGISTKGMGKCLTNLEVLQNLLSDIERFYSMSGEEINYSINTDYSGLVVKFITLGDVPGAEESQAEKIDGYLQRVKEWIRKRGHKRQTINGNWLDMRFTKKGAPTMGYDYYVGEKLRKVGEGIYTLDNTTDASDRELITIRNEAWEDGLKFSISGGDNQVVLKLVKR
jgi:hypothetical protein